MLTAATMLLIFLMSAQDGTESGNLSDWLLNSSFGQTIIKILPRLTEGGAGNDLRKYAHMAEYALLAFFSVHFFLELLLESVPAYALLCSFIFSFLYACSDEYHQTFVPGRAGQFSDVLIDMAGVVFSLTVVTLFCILRKESK